MTVNLEKHSVCPTPGILVLVYEILKRSVEPHLFRAATLDLFQKLLRVFTDLTFLELPNGLFSICI